MKESFVGCDFFFGDGAVTLDKMGQHGEGGYVDEAFVGVGEFFEEVAVDVGFDGFFEMRPPC